MRLLFPLFLPVLCLLIPACSTPSMPLGQTGTSRKTARQQEMYSRLYEPPVPLGAPQPARLSPRAEPQPGVNVLR
jgi:hypothetical protein